MEMILNQIPDYAKDLKLNLSSLLQDQALTVQQRYGLLLACAHAGGVAAVIAEAEQSAAAQLSAEAVTAAKAAASIMAMNNVYYRFVHLAGNRDYAQMPAKLRMNVIGKPGIDKVDFELFSLAVSAINGCGMCMDAHEKVLRDHGVSADIIQTAVRFGAVVQAVSATIRALPDNMQSLAQAA